MNYNDLLENAKKDLKIDRDCLDHESLRTPEIHVKWLDIYYVEGLRLKNLINKEKKLRKYLSDFYSGRLPDGEYEGHSFDPNRKLLKQEIPGFIESDERYIFMSNKVSQQEKKISFIESVISEIKNRNFQIRNSIEFLKYTQGHTF